jgi:hypothetical protein
VGDANVNLFHQDGGDDEDDAMASDGAEYPLMTGQDEVEAETAFFCSSLLDELSGCFMMKTKMMMNRLSFYAWTIGIVGCDLSDLNGSGVTV